MNDFRNMLTSCLAPSEEVRFSNSSIFFTAGSSVLCTDAEVFSPFSAANNNAFSESTICDMMSDITSATFQKEDKHK